MTRALTTLRSLVWLIHKDLTRELRATRTWPTMLLLGLVLVCLLAMQIDLPPEQQAHVVATLLWFAIVFAGTLAIESSFANEGHDGLWTALRIYPVSPDTIFIAKVFVNAASLALLELVLIPLFVVMTDVPLLARPGHLLLIALFGNAAFAAMGTLSSAVAASSPSRGGLIALVYLPLVAPVILACAAPPMCCWPARLTTPGGSGFNC